MSIEDKIKYAKENMNEAVSKAEENFRIQMINFDKDTEIIVPKSEISSKKDEEGNIIYKTTILEDSFTFTKELKRELLYKLLKAMEEGMQSPFIVLIPQVTVKKKQLYKNLYFPIPFFDNKLYFIKNINEVIVLEAN